MKQRLYISILLVTLLNLVAAAQTNTLTIPNATIAADQTIALPVNLDNTADIVAVQFTLSVPEGITVTPESATLAERAAGHTVVMQQTGARQYMAMVFSETNKPIVGRTGRLMSVAITTSPDLEEGTEHQLVLSDVVIGTVNGENLTTGYSAGKIVIAKHPDLDVTDVSVTAAEIVPNGSIDVSWQVANIGGLATDAGWSEEIFLDGADGSSKLMSTTRYDGTLASGATVSRNATIAIPQILGVHGLATVRVKIVPDANAGEPSWMQDNNAASTASAIMVQKMLYLSPVLANVAETANQPIRFSLERSGSTAEDETFTLAATTDPRVTLPETVTIDKAASGVYFYAQLKANGALDDDSIVNMTLSGNGYNEASARIHIEDDTYPSLSIIPSAQDVKEGGAITFTIAVERAPQQGLEVRMSSDLAVRFDMPATIVIPAGHTGIDVTVTAKDDNVPDVEQVATFTVSAAKHNSASENIVLVDDDVPTLELTLTPDAVSEAAGPTAVTATLRRTDNIDKAVTVKFSDTSDGGIYYGRQTVEMAPGVEEVTMSLGPIDNSIVDGERTYDISAAVWIASCSCNASSGSSGGVVTVPLTVYDNDGPTLTMTSTVSVLKEGSEMTVAIHRNTGTAEALTVELSSNNDTALDYPRIVVIPAGATNAEVTVRSIDNSSTGDDFTAAMTASCDGFAKGSLWFAVSDQTLPDAQIRNISVSESETEVGSNVIATVTLINTGSYELAEMTKVSFYLSNSSTAAATAYLQAPLAVGDSMKLSKTITLPARVATYSLYAVVNEGKEVRELLYTNNTSSVLNVAAVAPFKAEVATDKAVYQHDETIVISGSIQGADVANKELEVYVVNDGYRHTMTVTTDEEGRFAQDYKPYTGQMGHFAVGACYPSEALRTEMTAFDVYGLKMATTAPITCRAVVGETYNGSFAILNPGNLSLSGVKASCDLFENCDITVSCPEDIAGGAKAIVAYSIEPKAVTSGTAWQCITVTITSNEGATLEVPLYYDCKSQKGKLVASVNTIQTTMIKGQSRDYPFFITNTGKGETGVITLNLPNWMSAVTPRELPSMAQGDSATIILRLAPTEGMQLNVPVNGPIGINCANGTGLALPFRIEPVSEVNGTLTIDVCDEYTYNTVDAPHLKDAKVTVTHPTTGAVVASGTTNEDGLYSVVLKEGYYTISVTADRHESYRNNILIDPAVEKKTVVNLGFNAITVDWQVEETEVVDEYQIVTKLTYETSVPVPVVELTLPQSIDAKNLGVGESLMFFATLTNKGLITAQDVQLAMPAGFTVLKFEPLAYTEPFDLAPQQSVQVPIKVTHIVSDSQPAITIASESCVAYIGTLYYWSCGADRKWKRYERTLQIGTCDVKVITSTPSSSSSSGGYYSSGGYVPSYSTYNGGYYAPYSSSTPVIIHEDKGCDPCQNSYLRTMTRCAPQRVPIMTSISRNIPYEQKATGSVGNRLLSIKTHYTTELNNTEGWLNAINGYIYIYDGCIKPLFGSCPSGVYTSYIQVFQHRLSIVAKAADAHVNRFVEFYGDRQWLNADQAELAVFMNKFTEYTNNEISAEELSSSKPEAISSDQLADFISRWNNTNNNVESDNKIDLDSFDAYGDSISAAFDDMAALGYTSMEKLYTEAEDDVMARLNESAQSVCSSIKLEISQKLVMTRQAFRGTLTVGNGNENAAMTDVRLSLVVTDDKGNVATSHEFQITPEKLEGFDGNLNFTDGWTLDAKKTGVATILFIPTKYAAPTVGKPYSFGGILSYVDPFTGLEVTRDLAPVTLTVSPSPNLELTYFMQRDVYGDDPLTEAIEPCKEAEFSLLINNKGYGDAKNVRMTTEQPKIIDNQKGVLINFELISSQLNGGEKILALGGSVPTEFGAIPAKTTTYAQWWLKSSLLGHFTDYDIKATHITDYNNPDLTLLDSVTIHELIRSLEVTDGEDKMVGFLSNDFVDADDTPDMLYLSNGDIMPVTVATSSSLVKVANNASNIEYTLTVTPARNGWNYGNITDPTYGLSELLSVVRQSDNKEISLRNFWQTDRTLRDGKDPLYENRIHFADDFATGKTETYILSFAPMPELTLEVAEIEGIPAEGTIAHAQIEQATVVFNKYIDAATFTADDLSLAVQGVPQDMNAVGITTEDNKTFVLDLTEVNKNCGNGYYVLTVQTADITDVDGFNGKTGKSVGWNMYKDGLLAVNVTVSPAGAGTVDGNREVQYGDSLKFSAIANRGYEFSHWTVNSHDKATTAKLESIVFGDVDIVAHFVKESYSVTIDSLCNGGSITGHATGSYDFGDELTFTAVPDEDYAFKRWIVNEKTTGDANELLTIVVEGPLTISAEFVYIGQRQQTLAFAAGWNWVSSFLNEPLPFDEHWDNVRRVVSQFEETVNDPTLGVVGDIAQLQPTAAYKIDALNEFEYNAVGYLHNLEESPIVLKRGWNWMPYPYYESRPIGTVITNAEEGDYISSQYGVAGYNDGRWEGSIEMFNPGFGYLYKSASDKTLMFDFETEEAKESQVNVSKRFTVQKHEVDVHKYPNTMNVIAKLYDGDKEISNDSYNVYAMSGNELRGVGHLVNGVFYITIYGDRKTEISFIVENTNLSESYMANETLLFTNDVIGSRRAAYAITIGDATGIVQLTKVEHQMDIYSIEGQLISRHATLSDVKKLSRGIYIINGRKYMIK